MLKILFFFAIFIDIAHSKEFYKKNMVDKAHQSVSKSIANLSDNIDSFFADNKHEDVPNRSKLKISFDTYFREGRGPYVIPELNYQLVLPRTEKRLRLVFENENEDKKSETSKVRTNQTRNNNANDNRTSAGLRYMVEKSGIEFYSDAGIIVNIPPVVFTKFTAKKTIEFTNWILKVNEQIKWVNNKGLTSDLDLDFDKQLTRKYLLRMVNNTFWNDTDYVIRFENGPSLFHRISDEKALSYHAHVITVNEPDFVVENYLLQVTYRQLAYSNWLYFSISPFVNFPRTENFHRTPGLVVGFDAIFGKI